MPSASSSIRPTPIRRSPVQRRSVTHAAPSPALPLSRSAAPAQCSASFHVPSQPPAPQIAPIFATVHQVTRSTSILPWTCRHTLRVTQRHRIQAPHLHTAPPPLLASYPCTPSRHTILLLAPSCRAILPVIQRTIRPLSQHEPTLMRTN